MRHTMSITYKPKEIPVRHGDCRQTIRKVGKRKIYPNDVITFHGWTVEMGKSKRSWCKEVIVTMVIPIEISKYGIFVDGIMHAWTSWYPSLLARYDFIEPATGEELRDVLFGIYGVPDEPQDYIIIQW